MRIIAGQAKGRKLAVPPGSRPMTGRAREGIFSSLGSAVVEARVLDLFAGSGSLGLEALSRGAASAVFVEKGRGVAIIEHNIAAVGLGGRAVRSTVLDYLEEAEGSFDLAFVDPPYADSLASVEEAMRRLEPHMAEGAIVVVRRRRGENLPAFTRWLRLLDRRRYGDDEIFTYQKKEP